MSKRREEESARPERSRLMPHFCMSASSDSEQIKKALAHTKNIYFLQYYIIVTSSKKCFKIMLTTELLKHLYAYCSCYFYFSMQILTQPVAGLFYNKQKIDRVLSTQEIDPLSIGENKELRRRFPMRMIRKISSDCRLICHGKSITRHLFRHSVTLLYTWNCTCKRQTQHNSCVQSKRQSINVSD